MKSKIPFISIVILNYNGIRYLKRTIPPILKLDYPNYEIIVVDNGSTDKSIEFIRKFNKIRLIKNGQNFGYSKGKNIGVNSAKGEYILLLDNDILIKDKKIMRDLLDSSNNKRILQVPFLDIDSKITKSYGIYYNYFGQNFSVPYVNIKRIINYKTKLINTGGLSGGLMFFNRTIWESLNGFDENQKFYLDDFDISQRAWIYGYELNILTKKFIIHLGINNAEKIDDYLRRFRLLFSGQARAIIKNLSLRNLILTLPLLIIFHFFKAIKYSIIRRDFNVFINFLSSINLFIKNLPDTLKQRKLIQSKRVVKEDVFLKIKPPKFD